MWFMIRSCKCNQVMLLSGPPLAQDMRCAINFLWNPVQKFYFCSKVTRFAAENFQSLAICMASWRFELPLHLIFWKIYDTSGLIPDVVSVSSSSALERQVFQKTEASVESHRQTKHPRIKIPTFLVKFIHGRDFCRSPKQKGAGFVHGGKQIWAIKMKNCFRWII